MNFFSWLCSRRKRLATMSVEELRAQEMLLENERNRMQARIAQLSREKQKLIEMGAKEKTPELRRSYAQQYDLLHTEQMMLARQLNLRSKELLTVSRLRLLRETGQTARVAAAGRPLLRESDLALIEQLIENDRISTEVYQERLDRILQLGLEADEAATGLSPAAAELLRIWNDMDAGLIRDSTAAFDEAEKRLREQAAEA